MHIKQQISVEEEFRKNSELKKHDLQMLRDWVDKQPHLPKISDLDLILFLHSCYYQLESTKVTIDTYYTIRTHCPEFLSNRNVNTENIKRAMEVGVYQPLPDSTPEGYIIIMCKLMITDPSRYVFAEAIKIFNMSMDLWLRQHGTAPGLIICLDMNGIGIKHVPKINIMIMKKFLYYLQEALPVRLKGLHFVNAVPFMDKILAIMKPFMKKDLTEILYIHSTVDKFLDFVPKKILPSDIGGDSDSYETLHAKMTKNLIDNNEWFEYDEKNNRVDESKRAEKTKTINEIFGIEGSFKKLDID